MSTIHIVQVQNDGQIVCVHLMVGLESLDYLRVELFDDLKEEAAAESIRGGTVAPGSSARQQEGEVH